MPEKLKDLFFTASFVAQLGDAIQQVLPNFDKAKLTSLVFDADWETRELKERMRHLTHCLISPSVSVVTSIWAPSEPSGAPFTNCCSALDAICERTTTLSAVYRTFASLPM